MKVFVTPAAQGDIAQIGSWIAGDNPKRAISFMIELKKACEKIGDAPRGSVVVQRYVQFEIRRKPYHDYLIFYRIKHNTVEVPTLSRAHKTTPTSSNPQTHPRTPWP